MVIKSWKQGVGGGGEKPAAAAAQNGVQSVYKDTPGKKTLAVRLLLFVEWQKGGAKNRGFLRERLDNYRNIHRCARRKEME